MGDFVDSATTAYRDNETALAGLTQSLKQNVVGWNGDLKAINATADAGVNLGFSNAETYNSMTLLVAATHDQTEALRILAVAQDLARFKNISLQDAATALTNIEAGRARGLATLGINVKDYATTEERLAAVEKVVGGAAETFATTDLGKVDVAAAKTTESMSKLGSETSKLGADFDTVKADAIDKFAIGLGYVADRVNFSSQSLDRQIQILLVERDALRQGSDAWNNITAEIDKLTAAKGKIDAAAKAAEGLSHWSGKAADDVATLGDSSTATARAVNGLGDALGGTTGDVYDEIQALDALDRTGAQQKNIDALVAWKKATGALNAEQQTLYDSLTASYNRAKQLAGVSAGGGSIINTGIPTGQKASVQTVNVNVHLTSAQSIITPGAAAAIAARLGPYLTKYLVTHNVVPHQAVL